MQSSGPILEVSHITKHFGRTRAVDDLSLSIPAHRCFGLLGPNGAGKTTCIEIMEGILLPDHGTVLFRGRPLGREFQAEVGIQFQSTALQDYLTVEEVLRLFHRLYGRHQDLEHLINACALGELRKRDARKLSGGQRQRLLLAVALVNRPSIVFLDEPTTGLDPQARRNFWDLVEQIKADGTTIVLSTHYMEEASVLCEEIAIMDGGRIIAQGAPQQLLDEHYDDVVMQLPAQAFPPALGDLPHQLLDTQGLVELTTTDLNQTILMLAAHDVPLEQLRVRPRNLEDLFLDLTGRDLRN